MSTLRINVEPGLLYWAIERSGKDPLAVHEKFQNLGDWLSGDVDPTLKQLEAFAKYTYTPVGNLFLSEPPSEALSLPDFRAPSGQSLQKPSANLMDVINQCEIRQDWYRNYLISNAEKKLDFVASCSLSDSPEKVAAEIAKELGFSVSERAQLATWDAALTYMTSCADNAGVLVMRNGVVGSNTNRPLDTNEFSGFALVDSYAPLVFVNAKDSRSRQAFTLAHELAHIWLGEPGLSLNSMYQPLHRRIERWCDKVAAELLVPVNQLNAQNPQVALLDDEISRLAKHFKVSSLVVLRRLRDTDYIDSGEYQDRFYAELQRLRALSERSSGGGDYYRTQVSRTGKQFTRAVVFSALEGQTLYKDAFSMLGVKKQATFEELARNVGVML